MTERPPGEQPDAPDTIPAPDESTPEQPVVQHSGTPLVEPAEPTSPDAESTDDNSSA